MCMLSDESIQTMQYSSDPIAHMYDAIVSHPYYLGPIGHSVGMLLSSSSGSCACLF